MMALANTYGLLFIILLLGHGLIQVPRQLWETSFNDKQLQRLYFIATQVRQETNHQNNAPVAQHFAVCSANFDASFIQRPRFPRKYATLAPKCSDVFFIRMLRKANLTLV